MKKILTALALCAGMVFTAAPATATTMTLTETRLAVIADFNQRRVNNGCNVPLQMYTGLTSSAQYHATEMRDGGYVEHDSFFPPETATHRIQRIAQLPGGGRIGEDIGFLQGGGPKDIVKAWMASPGHKKEIIDCGFRYVGVGLSVSGPSGNYWVADFWTG